MQSRGRVKPVYPIKTDRSILLYSEENGCAERNFYLDQREFPRSDAFLGDAYTDAISAI